MDISSSLKDKGPSWANGCEQCVCGIVAAPEIIGAVPLYEQRAVECGEDMILFCNCRAGHMYRQHLRKVYNGLSMDSKRTTLAYINAALPVPTVHAATATPQGEPVTAAPGQREVAAP